MKEASAPIASGSRSPAYQTAGGYRSSVNFGESPGIVEARMRIAQRVKNAAREIDGESICRAALGRLSRHANCAAQNRAKSTAWLNREVFSDNHFGGN